MATRKNSVPTGENKQWNNDVNYAAVTLTVSEKDAFLSWMSGVQQDYDTWMEAVLEASYRVTFKVDYNSVCMMCTWTQQDNKSKNAGLTIVSRAETFYEAFWLNCYKVYVLYENQRLPDQKSAATWG